MLFTEGAPRVLAIGAHPDDVELGAGGFIWCLTHQHKATVNFLILTEGLHPLSPTSSYESATRRDEAVAAAETLGVPKRNVEVLQYPDCKLHEFGHEIIREIEKRLYGAERMPLFDIVLTHTGEDTHADHRVVHESTLSAVRDFHATVLLYQAPSTKPNGFHPTFFVKLDANAVSQKDRSIQAHVSQRDKAFMRIPRTFGLAGDWSIFLRLPTGTFLEAFEVYKSFF